MACETTLRRWQTMKNGQKILRTYETCDACDRTWVLLNGRGSKKTNQEHHFEVHTEYFFQHFIED